MSFSLTGPNEFFSQFSLPGWIFIILGLLERSGPSESILVALNSICMAVQLLCPVETTSRCLGKAQQLDLTFFFGFLFQVSRFSLFKLRCKAEIHVLLLVSITHALHLREIPWHATENCERPNKKKLTIAQCREFCVHTVAAPSIFLLS